MTGDAGAVAARERVAALLDRLTHVELGVVVVIAPDAIRLAARESARAAATAAERGALLDEATDAARATAMRIFSRAAFSGTWAATEMSASVASAADRVAAAAAFEEAATAAVVEDLVDDETLDTLCATTDELTRSGSLPTPGSLSSLASPLAGAARGPFQSVIVVAVGVACVVGALAFGSISGAIAVGGVVAAGAWLFGRRTSRQP